MPTLARHCRFVLLLVLLAAALPAARPVLAQSLVVTSSADTDDGGPTCGATDCTLRKAIRLANTISGPNTITFAPGVTTIQPQTQPLPPLTDNGTTIDGGSSRVTISGVVLAANSVSGHGLNIVSNNNTIRGLVIVGFPTGGVAAASGSGIYIDGSFDGGDNNRVYNCYLGVGADGATAQGNGRYGVLLANGADNNIIGGTGANERNVIAGNLVANVAIANAGGLALNQNNQIVGNYVGTNAAGTAPPANVNTSQTEAGISVSVGARGTLIADNLVGGHTSTASGNQIIAGITVSSFETTFNSALTPRDTTIARNLIGVNSVGTAIPNRVGILIGAFPNPNYGPYNTVIGDPLDPAGGRNVIAGNTNRGIEITESTQKYGNVTIAGNYIGLNASGAPLANGAEGIFVGRYNAAAVGDDPVVTVGPANVISGNALYGIRFRSGGHVVRGNFLGTNSDGSSSQLTPAASRTANNAPSIWIENGNAIRIGGAGIADRNIIAWSGSAAGGVGAGILIDPAPLGTLNNCSGPCATGGHTIENNFIGVRRDGNAALNSGSAVDREGIRVRRSDNNTIRNNVISGTGIGISLGGAAAGQEAGNNTIAGNRIGTRASGSLALGTGIGNRQDGLRLISGSNNTIQNNLIAFNGSASVSSDPYHGIRVGASNNQIVGNQLAFNGALGEGDGVRVNAATAVRIAQTTTTQSNGDGIALSNGGNGGQAPPTLTGVSAGPPPVLTGTACANCTVEVFTSSVAEDREGPLFLTSGAADGSGNFSIPVPGCLRYLTATATTPGNNTSPFTNALDTGALGPCATPPTFSLGPASPSSRNVNIGSSTIFTHTLTHNAPVQRTYVIQITSSLGWASGPATVTVPAAPAGGQSSVEFGVTVGVPLGTAPNTTHSVGVRAVFGAASSNEVTDTVTAVQPSVQPATPEVTPMTQTLPLTGASVTFTHTVRNSGDLPGNFEVVGLNFVGAPPAGWSIGAVTLTPTSLPAGGTATLTIVVNTPGATPPPGEVRVRFRVGVVGTTRQTDPVDDVISIPTVRSFTFLPADDPLIRTVPAGADAIFEYTLTNTGNAPDSFTVTPALPGGSPLVVQGVSATPSLTGLAAGAASTVRVTIRVPSATSQGAYNFTVTAAASGGASPPPAVTRNARVVVTGGGAARIDPGTGTPDPVDVRTAPGTVTFVNTVTNTGNAAVPINVPASFSGPAGWTATTTGNTCDDTPTIAPDGTCTFTVQVSVPQGVDAGEYPIQISATADNSAQDPPVSDFTATATITVNVQRFRGVELTPNREAEGAPGAVLTFTHTLTNTGNAADSFDLSVTSSAPGWTATVSPAAALDVPRNGTRTITVQVAIPAGLGAGAETTITVTATGRDGGPVASATDVARVASITAADLSPGQRRNLNPGESVTYTHTVTNTGTTTTAFIIETSDSAAGWSSAVTGSPTPALGPGQSATITVQVTAPASAARGEQNTTLVRVRAVGEGTPALDEEEDITAVGPARGVIIEPDRSGEGPPNSTVVFTHTVRNIGVEQGLFRLTVAEANGWPATVAPDLVSLGPGSEIEVTVRVFIPDGKRAGDPGFARVRVDLVGDPEIFDDAEDRLTVSRVAGVSLAASQVRLLQPGGRPQILSGLAVTNRGSAADVFDLAPIGLPAGWSLTITPSTIPVDREGTFRVEMQVTAPPSVAPGTTTRFFVEARSRFDGAVRDRVEVILVVPEAPPERIENPRVNIYLPLVRRAGQ